MNSSDLRLGKKLGLGLVCSAAVLLTACGGSSDSPSNSAPTSTPAPTSNPNPTATPAPTNNPTATPAPTGAPTGSKVSGPLDPLQDNVVSSIVANTVAPQLPAPLNSVAGCVANALNSLVDVPDAAINFAKTPGAGNPADLATQVQTSLTDFASQLKNTAFALNGEGSCTDEHNDPNQFDGNPFADTPLEGLTDGLNQLTAALDSQAAEETPDISTLVMAVSGPMTTIQQQLGTLPVGNIPVIGDLFGTLTQTTTDLNSILGSISSFDQSTTQAGVTTLVTNLLEGVALGVIPAGGSDFADNFNLAPGQSPSDAAGQIQTLINTLSGGFGGNLANLIPGNFSTQLTSIMSPSKASFSNLLGGANPLEGVLGGLAGQGANNPLEMLTSLLLINDAGLPLDALAAALGGNVQDANPLDVLSSLNGANPTDVTNLLSGILDDSLLNQVPVVDSVVTVVNTLTGGILGDILDGLGLGGLLGGLLGGN